MTVAAAYKSARTSTAVLLEAAREADRRQTGLVVIEVEAVDSMDLDGADARRAGLREEVLQLLGEGGMAGLDVEVHVSTGSDDVADVSHAVLSLARNAAAEVLVIGARRRSPVGKFLLGSSTQRIILSADMPVLVVKTG